MKYLYSAIDDVSPWESIASGRHRLLIAGGFFPYGVLSLLSSKVASRHRSKDNAPPAAVRPVRLRQYTTQYRWTKGAVDGPSIIIDRK